MPTRTANLVGIVSLLALILAHTRILDSVSPSLVRSSRCICRQRRSVALRGEAKPMVVHAGRHEPVSDSS